MIDEEGGISEVIQADVTDEESCKKAVERTVELFGAVHILVNIGIPYPPFQKERKRKRKFTNGSANLSFSSSSS